MKRIVISAVVLAAAVAFVVIATGASGPSTSGATYKVELDNAFGLSQGEQFKVAGVPAGAISKIDLDQKTLHAVVSVQVTVGGFGSFHKNATCQSAPQSLIGEYFLNCQPGNSGPVLKPGSTIPVTQTSSTVPGDLLQDVMRMPYRERLTLIINELGAGVAGNSENLQAALDRAVPALTNTDNLLNLLANNSQTIQSLTTSANTLVTELANNSGQVQRFIGSAAKISTDTATQTANLKATFQNLPPFLEELRPALAQLSSTVDANEPALRNLNSGAGQIDRLLKVIPPFSRSALPALQTLGQASVTGQSAVNAAEPVVAHLNTFASQVPELGNNLAIVGNDLNDRSRAVEADPRSPGGQGYTGLEALLQYVFNQTLNLDYLGSYGHVQAVNLFISPMCSALATPGTIARNLKAFGASYRQCYSWLGANQPGVNEPDPSNPGACPPDPGGEPSYAPAGASPSQGSGSCPAGTSSSTASTSATSSARSSQASAHTASTSSAATNKASPAASKASASRSSSSSSTGTPTVGQLLQSYGASQSSSSSPSSSSSGSSSSAATTATSSAATSPTSAPSTGDAQQLLNYLLAP